MSLEFQITRDPDVLSQYYQLRERCFRSELGLANFDGSEEEQDRRSQIMVALRDGRCVGGVRISSHVTLSSQLDQLGLSKEMSCMWERFAIDPVMRTLSMFREFSGSLVNASREGGYQHAMVLSSLPNARFYRRCHTALGVKFKIQRHVPHCAQGAFSGLEHYLSVAHLERRQQHRIAVWLNTWVLLFPESHASTPGTVLAANGSVLSGRANVLHSAVALYPDNMQLKLDPGRLLLDIGKPDAAKPYLDLVIGGADSEKLVAEAKDLLLSPVKGG